MAWVRNLSNSIDSFFTKEKAGQINRHLQYLRQDIQTYLVLRTKISRLLDSTNYHLPAGYSGKAYVEKLTDALSNIIARIQQLQPLLNAQLYEQAQEISMNFAMVLGANRSLFAINTISAKPQ